MLRRFEAEFLRPYRGPILLGLLGLLVQSVLLLPIPLLQGWVVDQLVDVLPGCGDRAREAQASDCQGRSAWRWPARVCCTWRGRCWPTRSPR